MSRVIDNRNKIMLFICITIIAMVLIAPIKTYAADSESTTKTYTVTYSAGKIAYFADGLYEEYYALIGTNGIVDVTQSDATGNIKITVEAGYATPDAPDSSDIVFYDEYDGDYVVSTGWGPTGDDEAYVTENAVYVVDYAALVNGVEYTIKYVDSATGNDVASPLITVGNSGDTITYSAKTITGYTYDEYTKEVVLTSDTDSNVITFYYTSTTDNTTTVTNTVTLPGTTTTTTAGAAAAAGTTITDDTTPLDDGTTDDGTTIEDETTPLDDGSEDETSDIEDETTPTDPGILDSNTTTFAIIMLIVIAAIVVAGTIVYKKKKKRPVE